MAFLCATLLVMSGIVAARAQTEWEDTEQLIVLASTTIVPAKYEDAMRDLAENRREEGLSAFRDLIEHLDDYPDASPFRVLSTIVKYLGNQQPLDIFKDWLLQTRSDCAVRHIRFLGGGGPGGGDPEQWRQLLVAASRDADSEAIRYALVNALNLELTGEELEDYLQSDEGLYDSIQTAAAYYVPAGDPSDLDRRRVERTLEAMQNVPTTSTICTGRCTCGSWIGTRRLSPT